MLPTGNDLVDRAVESGDPAIAEEAIREVDLRLKSASEAKDKAGLLLSKAVLNGFLHRHSDAREQLTLALEQAPTDPDVRFSFDVLDASLFDQEGRPDQAYARLTTVLSRHSERLSRPDVRSIYEDIQQRRGFDLVRIGKFQEAVPILEEVLLFRLTQEIRSAALVNLGFSYAKLENYEKARDYFEQAAAIGISKEWEGQSHYYLGVSYAQLHLLRSAKREFKLCEQHSVAYNVSLPNIYGWLSWICKGLGEKAESERYARLARPS
jgi:tetratricopeptide (TPR) repeat protein